MQNIINKGLILAVIILLIIVSAFPNICSKKLTFNANQKNITARNFGVPDFLQFGDIIFMDVKPILAKLFNLHSNKGFSNDHCAFYIGHNWFIEATDYSMSELGLFNGVQFTPIWFYRCWANNFTYVRVINSSYSQINQAFKFILNQYREPYQYGWLGYDDYMSWHCNPDIDDPYSPYYYPDDPYLDYWYCSEIIWASFLHQNINIDATPDPVWDPCENGYYYLVSVDDIRYSENVTIL